ncbi:alcohol dehydrogenase [bacterium (Candidatus Blackallbacteria) CG17_big_fil_post_rev_8_21_14_2_50_48_46]|uniref:alcohol dehydrogenase (NADP(+)) n=1 Tax=bacterium (Candidatus Blackallbacteria) CG17_big_fil_post_rev_8_21_14_2_50_48_46 TaxID=2014261 RepID=A0A2M7G664_9BACT|nr:MAG: alcohol dehydrogenase [bacterium (Candidatus Blackallbacteria) CG18_big_fil_WC_8_21_14_2_50_49_26]PIW17511.1 MAG: alcohol dehydrogenase [bacterium (Candidatus Blackallbacteria) CG17_big_fil_post_rev_8_21_14_2_50_48_46]PIW48365.1 MAG: alcohol dehydrogenase [bacterium (Candidatus Blackallbacteria) CG13_big_fil_rev_8_21_14_2_50_49_14]
MINAYAAFEPKAPLQPFAYDPGPLPADQVEIEVLYCGVCHSDVSVIDNEWGFSQYPLVAGHEVVGKIAALGAEVKGLQIGQTVGLGWHAGYCNQCAFCRSGDHNLCSHSQATIVGHYGGFADKVRAAANAVIPIPEGVDISKAGPLFCGGITVFNPLVQFEIKPTDKVAVIGIGGLGHLALKFLNAWGCEVTAFTSSAAKKTEAHALGAHHALNSRDPEEIASAAGRFDLIISTVNVKLDWNLYLSTLSPRGRLHFVGATLEPLDISVFSLMGGQRSVSASPVGSPDTIAKMLDFANRHQVEAVVETFPFEEINAALDRVREGKAHYRVVLSRA